MKNYLKALCSFSRKELNGMLVLFGLLLLLILAQPLTDWLTREPAADFSDFEREIALLELSGVPEDRSGEKRKRASEPPSALRDGPVLFPFDPNTASKDDLLKLGLDEGVVKTLLNYRKAGGRFRLEEDLKKIYGLPPEAYERLRPFLRIKKQQEYLLKAGRAGPQRGSSDPPAGKPAPVKHPAASGPAAMRMAGADYPVVEINTADSAMLLPLPGIGQVLSARIVKYRERLGGFHSAEQLLEVYGLDTANYQKFLPYLQVDSSLIKQININKAGYGDLQRLPYWSPVQINALLNYRRQHGSFSEIRELYNIRALESRTIQKVMPYLSLE